MFDMQGSGRKSAVYTSKKSRSGHPLRSFKCLEARGKECGGKAYARTPKAAASKIFSKWCNSSANPQKKESRCATVVGIKETTRGSAKKEYFYNAERSALRGSKKKGIDRDGTVIKYKFHNKLYSSK